MTVEGEPRRRSASDRVSVLGLFSAVRGMLRPLLVGQTVSLVFEDAQEIPSLYGDENKVSQILRNFISNALKFTERGEIRVTAQLNQAAQTITFAVTDTGIGIALEDQAKIFEEFTQVESPIQRKVKGTGLGLPLCRKLASLLGGQIELLSEVGVGSTFSLTLPLNYVDARAAAAAPAPSWQIDESRMLVLIVEDEAETRLIYEKYLAESPFQALAVSNLRQGRDALRQYQPRAIILDIALRGENTWNWLAELKADEATRGIPIMIASAVEDRGKGFALGADAYCVKPLERAELLDQLQRLTSAALNAEQDQPHDSAPTQVVIIDDEPTARYILSKLLCAKSSRVQEAENGLEGLRMIKASSPQLIFLDLTMPDISGFEVLNSLKTDASTQSIPVAVVTSATLTEANRRLLETQTCAIINKNELSRERIEDLWQQVIGQ